MKEMKSYEVENKELDLDLLSSKKLILKLLNIIECQGKEILELKILIQELRDENAILKGNNPKPKFPDKKSKDKNISSEKERKEPKKHDKESKICSLEIDEEVICDVSKDKLPKDAIFMGYEKVLVQGIKLKRWNVLNLREKYYSSSENRTYLGELKEEYIGGFSKEVHSLALCLKGICNVSEPKILEFIESLGLKMSSGTLSNILIKKHSDCILKEKEEIFLAGLESSEQHQTDTTQSVVNGEKHHTHIVCNDNYSSYTTKISKSRMSIIDVLRQNKIREYIFDDEAFVLMKILKVSLKNINFLKEKVNDFKSNFCELDAENLVKDLKKNKIILECAYLSAYKKEVNHVKILMTDDAPQYNLIAENSALCWIHEGRHYKKLAPIIDINRKKLELFLNDFWSYYKQLKEYKKSPTDEIRKILDEKFDELFSTITGYDLLDERIKKSLSKKNQLLVVLEHPETPLHNNSSELAVRQQVRLRDVSLQTKTEEGTKIKDALLTLVETAKKLNVSIWHYLLDRIGKSLEFESLASIIRKRNTQNC